MTTRLSGRVSATPAELLHSEILQPQFEYEVANLLPWYLAIEKVLLVEYVRLGLVPAGDARAVSAILAGTTAADLTARPDVCSTCSTTAAR